MNRRRWVRSGVTAVLAVAVGGGGYAAYAAATEGPSGYRTAPVTTGDVEQTLALSGTVSPVGRSDLAFGVDGTVASVAALGSHVRKGQVVARLDLTSLRRDVTRAQAAVDAARLQRERDEDTQADQVAAAASSSSTSSPPQQSTVQPTPTSHPSSQSTSHPTSQSTSHPTSQHSAGPTTAPTPSGSSSQVRHLLEQLAAQQQAVEKAQSSVSDAVADAQQAMDAQAKACGTATSAPTPSPSESSSPSAEPSDDPTATCRAALAAVETAQHTVADAEYAGAGNLRDALAALAQTLAAYAGQVSSGGTDSGGKQPTKQPTKQPATGPSTGPAETPTRQSGDTVTAASLAQDQATIDQAKADLVTARQALHGATLRAPAAGTVAAVDVGKGDAASAGSDVVTIVSKGLTTVAVDVSDTQVRQLELGQRATVTPAGSDTRLAGRVSRIGEVPDTSSGSTTYPVAITLDKRGLGLLTGTTAAVDVVVGSADGVLTVPASAVVDDAVTVLVRGRPQRVHVTTGLLGRARTQITHGLTAGEQVVLADLSTPLPTGDDSGSRGGFGRPPDVRGFGGPVTFTR